MFILYTVNDTFLKLFEKLHMQIKNINQQNMNLLDGMHEGILIISASDKEALYCNKMASKLFLNALKNTNESYRCKG